MKKLLTALLVLGSFSGFANETCVYVIQELNGKPLKAFASCSGDKKTVDMKIIKNDGPLSKAKHLEKLQDRKGMKLVSCSLAVRDDVAVSECVLTKI